MNARPGQAGATRTCPHCKTTILESATICPSCKHYLRFDSKPPLGGAGSTLSAGNTPAPADAFTALQVEGQIRHPAEGGAWEYSVVLVIRDDEGREINRQVVGVGALLIGDERTFSLAVEVTPTNDMRRPTRSPVRRGKH